MIAEMIFTLIVGIVAVVYGAYVIVYTIRLKSEQQRILDEMRGIRDRSGKKK